ncbi:MAG: outer membrane beta-barrel protein [Bacteroidales bacterium]|nr:outer membrane beta-barrel protein [Bacteroidales bacterium]
MIRKGILISLILVLALDISAQVRRTRVYSRNQKKEHPAIGLEIGFINSRCDMGSHDKQVTTLGASAFVSYRIKDHFGMTLNMMSGTLSDRFYYPYQDHDFRSDLLEFSLHGQLNLERLLDIEDYNIVPYVGTGAGILFFKSFGNKTDPDGNPYFYWNDGTVRTESQWDFTWQSVDFLLKDRVYETPLNRFDQYRNHTFLVLLEGGAKIVLSPQLYLKVGTVYTFTFTDYIDHDLGYRDEALKIRSPWNDDNDGYFYTSVGLMYDLAGKYTAKRMIRPKSKSKVIKRRR